MIRALAALLLLLGAAAQAQEPAPAPTVEVAVTPEGPVTVGTAIEVDVTVLVPTFMPKPPVWPDLEIADAITRLPERATAPVTRRIGGASWSGLVRRYEIVPQRAADYDLSGSTVEVTYADPSDSHPRQASLPLPAVVLTATVPPGAEGLDPYVAASALTLAARVDGLPEKPKPGDAFTLTLTTSATGTPAMLLPPLLDRLPVPPGLRAYPREPALADRPGERGGPATGTRTEAATYVIEAPGSFAIPGASLSWWNTDAARVEKTTTDPVSVEVAAPPGWRPASEAAPRFRPWLAAAILLIIILAGVALGLLRRQRDATPPSPPSERALYRQLRGKVSRGAVGSIRPALAAWLRACDESEHDRGIETALVALERTEYGPAPNPSEHRAARQALLAALRDRRSAARSSSSAESASELPPLNPVSSPSARLEDHRTVVVFGQ